MIGLEPEGPGWIVLELQGVEQADGEHEGRQLVVAVGPLAEDLQEEVDLGGRADDDGPVLAAADQHGRPPASGADRGVKAGAARVMGVRPVGAAGRAP